MNLNRHVRNNVHVQWGAVVHLVDIQLVDVYNRLGSENDNLYGLDSPQIVYIVSTFKSSFKKIGGKLSKQEERGDTVPPAEGWDIIERRDHATLNSTCQVKRNDDFYL